jgi:hypothetical protein
MADLETEWKLFSLRQYAQKVKCIQCKMDVSICHCAKHDWLKRKENKGNSHVCRYCGVISEKTRKVFVCELEDDINVCEEC